MQFCKNIAEKTRLELLENQSSDTPVISRTIQFIQENCVLELLQMAQKPKRGVDFKPLEPLKEEVKLADEALLALSEMCSIALIHLAFHGWEVAEDVQGKCLYMNSKTGQYQHLPPQLDVDWPEQVLHQLPLLVAPFVVDGEVRKIVWPLTVVYKSKHLSVLDLRSDTTIRHLQFGCWKGIYQPDAETDRSWGVGSHLEEWYLCTLAGLCLLEQPTSVLVVGLHSGALCSFLQSHAPTMRLTIVEPDQELLAVASDYFGFSQDLVKNVHSTSIDAFISTEKFDVILVQQLDLGKDLSHLLASNGLIASYATESELYWTDGDQKIAVNKKSDWSKWNAVMKVVEAHQEMPFTLQHHTDTHLVWGSNSQEMMASTDDAWALFE
ncbi:hypothetical protein EDD86DRAFT_213236, partial [Gorgonomyces haynaldii]